MKSFFVVVLVLLLVTPVFGNGYNWEFKVENGKIIKTEVPETQEVEVKDIDKEIKRIEQDIAYYENTIAQAQYQIRKLKEQKDLLLRLITTETLPSETMNIKTD